jgi:uncharacterized protein with PIN domain
MLVVDSSALIAFIRDEDGAGIVEKHLTNGLLMSVVNYGSAAARTRPRRWMQSSGSSLDCSSLPRLIWRKQKAWRTFTRGEIRMTFHSGIARVWRSRRLEGWAC